MESNTNIKLNLFTAVFEDLAKGWKFDQDSAEFWKPPQVPLIVSVFGSSSCDIVQNHFGCSVGKSQLSLTKPLNSRFLFVSSRRLGIWDGEPLENLRSIDEVDKLLSYFSITFSDVVIFMSQTCDDDLKHYLNVCNRKPNLKAIFLHRSDTPSTAATKMKDQGFGSLETYSKYNPELSYVRDKYTYHMFLTKEDNSKWNDEVLKAIENEILSSSNPIVQGFDLRRRFEKCWEIALGAIFFPETFTISHEKIEGKSSTMKVVAKDSSSLNEILVSNVIEEYFPLLTERSLPNWKQENDAFSLPLHIPLSSAAPFQVKKLNDDDVLIVNTNANKLLPLVFPVENIPYWSASTKPLVIENPFRFESKELKIPNNLSPELKDIHVELEKGKLKIQCALDPNQ